MDLWTCGPVGCGLWTEYVYDVCNRKCASLWTCGPVGCGPNNYIMYITGSADLCGPVDLWTCGPVGCGPNNYIMYITGSADLCGPVDLRVVDRITISCT